MIKHGLAILILTALTQLGGIAWLLALVMRALFLRFWVFFFAIYLSLSVAAHYAAPLAGREPLPCLDSGPSQIAVLNPLFCVLNRQYVHPAIKAHGDALASHMHQQFPGTRTRALDGSFPFVDGFPLLPHLSHTDGTRLDLAYYYRNASGAYELGRTKSPIGYWGFETPPSESKAQCIDSPGLSMRWDMAWLQPYFRDWTLDENRTRAALQWLADHPLGTDYTVLIEPYLEEQLSVSGEVIQFQGCQAARHDDHLEFSFQP